MRRRLFWSMLGIATLALVLVGVFGAVLGQVAVSQETIRQMTREAAAIERLVGNQFLEESGDRITLQRLSVIVRNGELPEDSTLGRRLRTLLATAEQITGGRLVDLGWIDAKRRLHLLLNPTLGEALRFDITTLQDGNDSVVRGRIPGEEDAVLAVAHPMKATRLVIVVFQRATLINGRSFFRVMLIAFGLAALLSAIGARLLARRLSKRGAKLAEAARNLADGDFSARVDLPGDDEVADIARAFNEMADRLEATQSGEREFLMSVGHDLRTPLTTIGGYAEALEEGGLDEASVGRIGGVLSSETGRLRRLIEDLMMLARLDAKEFTLRPESVDVAAHLRGIADTFQQRAADAGLRFLVDVEETGSFETDPDRLAQISGNLIENALRYTPEAGTVTFRVTNKEHSVVLEVVDSGPGIETEDLPRVFDRFFVAHRYRRVRPEGSGLGLSIVHRLVEAMRGTVTVSSGDTGTTFRVELPK
ncbi:alkaline phosphatase synthesis sensor protein PhoR [bacterium BMS3Abin02]|nr:alkaline phosphatase synthesis sensor protein PhoR [bacterium BMS3Abin02]GBE23674.1 alkaline phosphatase synthesis sensor protein PhoR [bacterium BMS3Bbin01]HDH24576.1 HAMP domain-containing histidine kinase [Actinomycetota bacterium]